MKLKKVAVAAAIAAMFSQTAFADYFPGSDALTYGTYSAERTFSRIVGELDDFTQVINVASLNSATVNGSIEFTAETIKMGAASVNATAGATAGATGASDAVAKAISGNSFTTLAIGAMNTVDITAAASNIQAFDYKNVDMAGTSGIGYGENFIAAPLNFSAPIAGNSGSIAGNFSGVTSTLGELSVLSVAINSGAIDASVHMHAALDTNRDTGWFLDKTVQAAASIDLTNLAISTTAIGAMNKTTVSLTNALSLAGLTTTAP
ncbi:MAG: hypothetical protein ACOYB1_14885 [Limnohabitans sp.]